MKPIDVVNRLQEAENKKDREEIVLDAWDAGCNEFFAGVHMAYDPMVTFGVKKVPKIVDYEEDEIVEFLGWNDFVVLANDLATRKLSGDGARNALLDAVERFPVNEWNDWYRRILLKNMDAVVGRELVNRVLKRTGDKTYRIVQFSCQEPRPFEGDIKALEGKWYADQDISGERVLVALNKDNNTSIGYDKDGNVIDDYQHIIDALVPMISEVAGSIVFDGMMHKRSAKDLMSGKDDKYFYYAIFDAIPLRNFRMGKCKISQLERHRTLCSMMGNFQDHAGKFIYVLPKLVVDFDDSSGYGKVTDFLHDSHEAGYGGILLKKQDSGYAGKRNNNWLKLSQKDMK